MKIYEYFMWNELTMCFYRLFKFENLSKQWRIEYKDLYMTPVMIFKQIVKLLFSTFEIWDLLMKFKIIFKF